MEIPLPAPFAEGRTANVYDWQDGCILKLYHDWCPPDWAETELRTARAITEAGIPAPGVFELIELNNRRGIVYERIKGISMLRDMNTHPWTLLRHARTLAELHVRIHGLSVAGIQSYRDGLGYTIKRAPYLEDNLRQKALERLASLPDGDRVCHGDFHPGNVLITDQGPIVIDWVTACSGNPWADVARTSMILIIGAKAAGRQVHPLVRSLIALFHRSYLKRYRELKPDQGRELRQWVPVIAAARLDEQITPERAGLLEMIKTG